jgi:hypothetical protein
MCGFFCPDTDLLCGGSQGFFSVYTSASNTPSDISFSLNQVVNPK